MKLRNKFMPAMLMLGVVAFSSCDKQETETMEPVLEQGALSHILADSAEVTSYNYAGSQLSQVNHYDTESGGLETYEKYERDAKGRLVKSRIFSAGNHVLLSEQEFVYNTSGQLTQSLMTYYNGSKVEYQAYATYKYNADERLEKKTVYEGTPEQENATVKSYTVYEVLTNGNYTQEKQYVMDDNGEAALFSTTTFSFDTNVNPLHEHAEPGTASSPNNLVASSTLVHNSKKTYKYAYTYTYDERGLPLSQTAVTPDGKRQTYQYLYSN